jgi:glucose dehydrogenase
MNRAGRKHFLGSVGLCLACSVAAGQNTGWTVYNGGPDGDHYSPLTQINRGNVNGLKVAWSFDTGEKGVLEDNPLIVGRVLYAYTQSQKVIALDAATGKLKWKFDSEIIARQPSRGVAYWTDGKQRLIFAQQCCTFFIAWTPIPGGRLRRLARAAGWICARTWAGNMNCSRLR